MGGPKRQKLVRVGDYLAAQPESHRPTMEALRALIRSVVPEATERISYGIICFQHHYMLVGIGATKTAVSLHSLSPGLVESMKDEIGQAQISGATLHFSPREPLPEALIVELVRRRARENEQRAARQSVPRNSPEHHAVALEAANKAATVLPLFEKHRPHDHRPRQAIDAIAAWARGERALGMAEVRRLSLAAHSAAREATTDSARSAARAAGHAIATWHVPSHAEGASLYAAKALSSPRAPTRTRA